MIKALFFDLDGTLLTSNKIISDKTKMSLIKCKEKGIKLFVATARFPLLNQSLPQIEDVLNLFDGGSFYNGGCIKINEKMECFPIPNDIVKKIIEYTYVYDNLNIALQSENELHAFRFPLKNINAWGLISEQVIALNQVKNLNTVKILIFYENLVDSKIIIDEKLVTLLKKYCAGKAQFSLTDKGKVIQITAKSADKLSGIEKIRKKLKLKKDEIAVFGDDFNDIEMLSAYKYSVAMGNAEKEIKDSAEYVTLDNNNDGIHYAIKNILKIILE
ncbi:MAG: HAD family hydrolase [Treponema sp.]|nr:HAD family hydrolase [Treponema sp.]MCL2251314.1 HAD family hydrolase [Treponema sp.]